MAEETLEVRIRAIQDGVTQTVNQTRSAIRGLRDDVNSMGGTMDPAARRMQYLNQAMKDMGRNALIMGGAIGGALTLAVREWVGFSNQLSSFQSVSGATGEQMRLLQDEAMRLGEKFGMSSTDVLSAAVALQKAGVSTADILGGALSGALTLAASDAMSLADAAEIASIAMTQFGLAGKDVPHVADLLAAGAAEAVGDVKDLGWALRQSGLVANMFGLSIEDTVGTLAAFAAQGLIGSDAGTSFKSMLLALASPSKIAQKQMDELGISVYDANGAFIGITGVAGELQEKMMGLDEKSRNAAMSIIFGQDAIRSATALYKLGAQGLEGWIQKVDQAGKAEEMATKRLDNLGGDLKKLQATFQNTLIGLGQSADGFLRPIVQNITNALRWFNSLDEGAKGMLVTFAAVAAGALLLGGAVLRMVPAIADTVQAFRTMNAAHSGLVTGLGKAAVAAGAVAAAFLLVKTVGMIFTQTQTKSVEEMTQAIIKLRNTANSASLDDIFKGWTKLGAIDTVAGDIDTLGEAVSKLVQKSGDAYEGFSHAFDGLREAMSAPKTELGQLEDRFKSLGDTMGSLVQAGKLDTAAAAFKAIATEFERNGKSAQDALNYLPGYRDALMQVASAANVNLETEDLLDLARGKIPAKLAEAQAAMQGTSKAQEAMAQASQTEIDKLTDLGVGLDAAINDLNKFIDALFRAGSAQLDQNAAARDYVAAAQAVTDAVQKNGTTLDINTAKGRENEAAYDAMAKAGMAQIGAMAANGASQEILQGKLKGTYDDLVTAAGQFVGTAGEADALARSVLGIPPGVSIDSWMSDYAKQVADATQQKLDAINGKRVTTYIDIITTRVENIITRSSMEDLNGSASGSGRMGTFAHGGAIYGPGPKGVDSVALIGAPGEHVWTAEEVDAVGGQQAMYSMRAAIRSGHGLGSIVSATANSAGGVDDRGGQIGGRGQSIRQEIADVLDGAQFELIGANALADSMAARIVLRHRRK